MNEKTVSLEDMLKARERRNQEINGLIKRFQMPLLVAKLNIPGPIKDNVLYRHGIIECKKAIKNGLEKHLDQVVYEELKFYETGAELYMVINMDSEELKKKTMFIEENHLLGRLFDIDVQNSLGLQLSRTMYGADLRKCLICNEFAYICGRSRAHDLDTVVNYIQSLLSKSFVKNNVILN